jgi:hypothetical protein
MVTFDMEAGEPLANRMWAAGIRFDPVFAWGDYRGYAAIQRVRPALTVLDASPGWRSQDLIWHLRAMLRFGPTSVLAESHLNAAMLLDAGASNVIVRSAPIAEATARLRADLRRLRRGREAIGRPLSVPIGSAQQFLLQWLMRVPTFCCHELRYLLGTPRYPLPLPALRARLRRILPLLDLHGLRLDEVHTWGIAHYTVTDVLKRGYPGL